MNGIGNVYLNQVTATTTGADQPLIGPNRRRRALIFSAPQSGRVTISFSGPAVLDNGLTMYTGTAPFEIDMDTLGNSMMGEIRIIGSAGAILFTVLELSEG